MTVDGNGVVTAVGNGETDITVTVDDISATVTATVDQEAVSITILEFDDGEIVESPDEITVMVGDTGTVLWRAEDANGNEIDPEYKQPTITDDPPGIVSIGPDGFGTAVEVGDAEVVASMDGAADTLVVKVLGVYSAGPFNVTNQSRLDDFAEGRYGRVEGDLVIKNLGALTDVDELETLREVGGDVLIWQNDALTDLSGLRNLEFIEGGLIVEDNPDLPHLEDLTALEWIGGNLELYENPSLSSLGNLPALTEVYNVLIEGGGVMVGLPQLALVWGTVQVGGTAGFDPTILEGLAFPALTHVIGSVNIYGNPNLLSVGASELVEVGGFLNLENNAKLQAADFQALETVGESNYYCCEDIGLPAARVAGERTADAVTGYGTPSYADGLYIHDLPALVILDLTSLWKVTGTVHVGAALGLATVPFSALQEAGDVEIHNLSQTSLVSFPALQEAWSVEASENTSLLSLAVPVLTSLTGSVVVEDNVGLDAVEIATSSTLAIPYQLRVTSNDGLTRVDAPGVESVGLQGPSGVSIFNNADLASVDLGALEEVGSLLEIEANGTSESALALGLDLSSLESVGNNLEIIGNPRLPGLSLPALTSAGSPGSGLWLEDLPALASFSAPSLTSAGMVIFKQVGAVASLTLPVAGTTREVHVVDNPALQSVSFPNLEETETDLELFGNPALEGILFPSLTTVGGSLDLSENDALETLDGLSALTSGLSSLNIANNEVLSDVGGLEGLGDAALGDPIISGNFTVTGNPSLCDTDVFALLSVLDNKYEGDAVGGSETTSGNKSCGPS